MRNQLDQSIETHTSRLSSYLKCLNCGSEQLTEDLDRHLIECTQCNQSYPLILFGETKIPFVFSDIEAALYGWSARLNGFVQKTNNEIENLSREIKDKKLSKVTKTRLKLLLRAKKNYKEQVTMHLSDLRKYFPEQNLSTKTSIAKNQGIDSYINNLFRDWSWENGENEELLASIEEIVKFDEIDGVALTLGAGASRFSYDFHNKYEPQHSVLLDINPLLMGAAGKILDGDSFSMYEFPVAPKNLESFAVSRQCVLPQDNKLQHQSGSFSYLIADALDVPLSEKEFDTVLTPWLIDIIPIDLRDFIPRVNRLLKAGGKWINTGSLAFFHKNEHWNYSEEEVVDMLKKYGFEDIKTSRKTINYLSSPHSAHGRVENVFSFSATKKFDSIVPKKFSYLPPWINDITKSIPTQPATEVLSSKYLLQSQVLSVIDGRRSIADIGQLLAQQYQMSEQSACAAVRQILIDNYQDILE